MGGWEGGGVGGSQWSKAALVSLRDENLPPLFPFSNHTGGFCLLRARNAKTESLQVSSLAQGPGRAIHSACEHTSVLEDFPIG